MTSNRNKYERRNSYFQIINLEFFFLGNESHFKTLLYNSYKENDLKYKKIIPKIINS